MPTIKSPEPMSHDALILGGSYAGLSAAMQLVRARRRVLVIDDGRPRNRFAARAHGVLTNDGKPGAEIAAVARAQVVEEAQGGRQRGEAQGQHEAQREPIHQQVTGGPGNLVHAVCGFLFLVLRRSKIWRWRSRFGWRKFPWLQYVPAAEPSAAAYFARRGRRHGPRESRWERAAEWAGLPAFQGNADQT